MTTELKDLIIERGFACPVFLAFMVAAVLFVMVKAIKGGR